MDDRQDRRRRIRGHRRYIRDKLLWRRRMLHMDMYRAKSGWKYWDQGRDSRLGRRCPPGSLNQHVSCFYEEKES